MCLIGYILTRVKKQKLTPSKNSSLWMKTLLKNIYKWNSCRGGDQPVSPYVHRTNKNVTVVINQGKSRRNSHDRVYSNFTLFWPRGPSPSFTSCNTTRNVLYSTLSWSFDLKPCVWSGPTSLNSFLKQIIYSQLFCYSFAQNFKLWVFYSRTQKYCRRNFPPIGNPRQQIVWLVRSFIIFQRMTHQTNLT